MAPPAKRRKRNVLPSSSEDDGDEGPSTMSNSPLSDPISSSPPYLNNVNSTNSTKAVAKPKAPPVKPQPRAKAVAQTKPTRGGVAAIKSPTLSPSKSKKKGMIDDKVKSGNIHTFFTKQAQRQQAEALANGSNTQQPKLASQVSKSTSFGDEDFISDDDIFEGNAQLLNSMVVQAARKRARGSDAFKIGDGIGPSASQKFIKPKEKVVQNEDDMRPWAERFAPENLDELVVHKAKVDDVRKWLTEVINGQKRQRLLILKGTAGTGKTTTVQLLAKSMDCNVLEWRNPIGSVATSEGYLSMTAQFEEFMGRGGKFGQLDLFSDNGVLPSNPEVKPLDRRKQIILVEEFPNTFTRSSSALQSFRSTIVQYLASNTPPLSMAFNNQRPSTPITPVVMIISETLLTTTSASADSFTAHRLLGPEILQHPGVQIIEFNPIAPTFLAKGLQTVVQKESRKSGRKRTPGPQVIAKLGAIGDIRSAIGSLEFMCLKGDVNGDWGAKITFAKTKKADKSTALTSMEEESLELVTRREASFGIFHAVGKVVHNKRDEILRSPPVKSEQLPGYIAHHARPRMSEVMVDELIDQTGTDTQTFVAALHENYLMSCDAPATSFDVSSLDHVNGCIDALSDSDLLCPSWDGSFGSTGLGGGSGGRGTGGDIMRQDEISFQIAVRGILFSLPYPVKRKSSGAAGFRTGKGGDEFKMFYPTSLKLWRMKEEIESTIDLWVSRLMKGDDHLKAVTAGAAAFARPKGGTVESWKNTRNSAPTAKQKEADTTPLMAVGTSARKEMLLERLPYMVLIAKARRNGSSMLAIKDMEKVTSFHGIGGQPDDDSDDGDKAVGEEWATDKPGDGRSPKKKALVIRGRGQASGLPLQQVEQKLVLSDDDIEDD